MEEEIAHGMLQRLLSKPRYVVSSRDNPGVVQGHKATQMKCYVMVDSVSKQKIPFDEDRGWWIHDRIGTTSSIDINGHDARYALDAIEYGRRIDALSVNTCAALLLFVEKRPTGRFLVFTRESTESVLASFEDVSVAAHSGIGP